GVRAHLKLAGLSMVRSNTFWSQRGAASGAGTPAYMPPEVWNGQAFKHSDQYSLAVSYTELRRGKPVFSGSTLYDLMISALTRDPDLSGLEQGEQAVLRRALDKDASKRFESCLDFAHALERAY